MRRFVGSVFAAALVLPTHAIAQSGGGAILSDVRGDVLIDVGDGFAPARGDVRLKLGDRVMVTKAGHAVLSYGAGCSFPLTAPSMTTIEETGCATTTQDGSGNTGVFVATGLSVVSTLTAAGIGLAEDDEEQPVSP
jgi:hypothetical protein